MNKIHVKPAPGVQVRTETGAVIPKSGQRVQDNSYYRRRIKDGDLVLIENKTSKRKGASQ